MFFISAKFMLMFYLKHNFTAWAS